MSLILHPNSKEEKFYKAYRFLVNVMVNSLRGEMHSWNVIIVPEENIMFVYGFVEFRYEWHVWDLTEHEKPLIELTSENIQRGQEITLFSADIMLAKEYLEKRKLYYECMERIGNRFSFDTHFAY